VALRSWPDTPGAAAALSALVALAGACQEPEPVTVVFVTVEARPGLREPAELLVKMDHEAASVSQSFDIEDREFPVSFTVTPTGRTGALAISVAALDADGLERGTGQGQVTVVPDQRVDLTVTLEPSDFVVNSSPAGTQRLTFQFEGLGRQLAAGPDGTFWVDFVNDCAMLQRCDVLARRFAADGSPLFNATSMTDGELIANLTSEYTDAPAVAAGANTVLMVWETSEAIKGVALSDEGDHLTFTETVMSSGLEGVNQPSVAALASGDFIVVWAERRESGFETAIRGRLIDATGTPEVNPVTGDDLDFPVSASATGDEELPHVAALAQGRGFVVAWRHREETFGDANLRLRFYDSAGLPTSATDGQATSYASGEVSGPHVVGLGAAAAAVAWAVTSPDDPLTVDGAILVGRFGSPRAAATGAQVVLASSLPTDGRVVEPVLARREDGVLAVAWPACGVDGDGQACGVTWQALRPTGAPVAQPAVANTTRAGDQTDPCIAALPDAFALAWSDASMAPPDTDRGAVRARILYLDADRRDGVRGALCGSPGDAACDAGLACTTGSQGIRYCHDLCDPSGAPPCPGGGLCTTAGESATCVY
jgi:hypothetical protein